MYEFLDRRYAVALYEVAEKRGCVKEYIETLKEISDIIYNNADILHVLKHPNISTQRKKRTFKELFESKIDAELLSFLLILIDKGRILYLREKLQEMEKILLEKNNTLIADVKTAVPLTESHRSALIVKLEAMYNKRILLHEKIDLDILGGVWVRVGTDIIDGTVKSRLHDIKETAMTLKWR